MSQATQYRCTFIFNNVRHVAVLPRPQFGIEAFSGGFWINSDRKFTAGSDARHWIPPSQLVCISIEQADRE